MLQPVPKSPRKRHRRWPLRAPALFHTADGWDDSHHTHPPSRPAAAVTPVREFPDTSWGDDGPTRGVEAVVEDGAVLSFPQLPFVLTEAERRFLDERWTDGRAKNISVRWPGGALRGAACGR